MPYDNKNSESDRDLLHLMVSVAVIDIIFAIFIVVVLIQFGGMRSNGHLPVQQQTQE